MFPSGSERRAPDGESAETADHERGRAVQRASRLRLRYLVV